MNKKDVSVECQPLRGSYIERCCAMWCCGSQGKPYHISALYLVDLKRFREMAAGDQLRCVSALLLKGIPSI